MIMIRYCNPNQLDNTFRSFQENFSVVQYRYISYNIALIEGDQTGTDIAVPINYPLEGWAVSDQNPSILVRSGLSLNTLILIQFHAQVIMK